VAVSARMNTDEHGLKTSNLLGALSVFIRFYPWPLHFQHPASVHSS
jgi:hypothetical protein